MNEDELRIVTDIARDVRIAMTPGRDSGGKLTSHPMTTSRWTSTVRLGSSR